MVSQTLASKTSQILINLTLIGKGGFMYTLLYRYSQTDLWSRSAILEELEDMSVLNSRLLAIAILSTLSHSDLGTPDAIYECFDQ